MAILNWYNAWHSPKKIRLWKSLVVYALLVIFVAIPPSMGLEESLLLKGETIYLNCESSFVAWLEKRGWLHQVEPVSLPEVVPPAIEPEHEPLNLALIVSGTSIALQVRDIPSTENGEVLDQVANGNTVIWSGSLVFAEADYGHIETWVKITTPNGVEGWARLFYLHPENYDDYELFVQIQE